MVILTVSNSKVVTVPAEYEVAFRESIEANPRLSVVKNLPTGDPRRRMVVVGGLPRGTTQLTFDISRGTARAVEQESLERRIEEAKEAREIVTEPTTPVPEAPPSVEDQIVPAGDEARREQRIRQTMERVEKRAPKIIPTTDARAAFQAEVVRQRAGGEPTLTMGEGREAFIREAERQGVAKIERELKTFEFAIKTTAETPERIRTIREQAEEFGLPVKIVSEPGASAVRFEVESRGELPKGFLAAIPTRQAVREKRIQTVSETLAASAVERALPGEKLALSVRTLLAPEGTELIGATVIGEKEKVISKKLASEIRISLEGETPAETTTRSVNEFVPSPVFEIEIAALGGVFLGGGSAAAKAITAFKPATPLMVGAFAGLGIGTGISATEAFQRGDVARGIGEIATFGAAVGAGVAGFKIARATIPKEITVDLSKITEFEVDTKTIKIGEKYPSKGDLEVIEPEAIRGIRGGIVSIAEPVAGKPGKFKGPSITHIPKQTTKGGLRIKESVSLRKFETEPITEKLTAVKTESKLEGIKGKGLIEEQVKIETQDVILREFKVAGEETKPKSVKIETLGREVFRDKEIKIVTKEGPLSISLSKGYVRDVFIKAKDIVKEVKPFEEPKPVKPGKAPSDIIQEPPLKSVPSRPSKPTADVITEPKVVTEPAPVIAKPIVKIIGTPKQLVKGGIPKELIQRGMPTAPSLPKMKTPVFALPTVISKLSPFSSRAVRKIIKDVSPVVKITAKEKSRAKRLAESRLRSFEKIKSDDRRIIGIAGISDIRISQQEKQIPGFVNIIDVTQTQPQKQKQIPIQTHITRTALEEGFTEPIIPVPIITTDPIKPCGFIFPSLPVFKMPKPKKGAVRFGTKIILNPIPLTIKEALKVRKRR